MTDEFSRWFEALSEPDAEDVASALDVLVEAGGELAVGNVSRLILWFDGTRSCAAPEVEVTLATHALERVAGGLGLRAELLRFLESQSFSARLGRLDAATAARALALVERVRAVIHGTRTYVVLTRGAGEHGSNDRLEADFLELLRLVGLDSSAVPASEEGLWELSVAASSGAVRILYGIDRRRKRVVLLLGERLDRAYYGDSVRFAERRFRRYRREAAQSAERA